VPIYRRLVSQWQRPDEIATAGHEPPGPLADVTIAGDFPELVPRMQFLDLVTYLPDDILTKVDRATLGHCVSDAQKPFRPEIAVIAREQLVAAVTGERHRHVLARQFGYQQRRICELSANGSSNQSASRGTNSSACLGST
jgi:hypothetical protein